MNVCSSYVERPAPDPRTRLILSSSNPLHVRPEVVPDALIKRLVSTFSVFPLSRRATTCAEGSFELLPAGGGRGRRFGGSYHGRKRVKLKRYGVSYVIEVGLALLVLAGLPLTAVLPAASSLLVIRKERVVNREAGQLPGGW